LGTMVLIAGPHSSWYDFLPPLIVAGIGMGGTFAPLTTTAMREVPPRLAGAASGVLNTTRQVGAVIGTAAVGALLQNRLISSLAATATSASAGLPPQLRASFIGSIRQTAASGLVGTGTSGTSAPPGTPHALVAELAHLGAVVFTDGFVHAMRWTMVMPIAVVCLAAISCLGIKRIVAARPAPSGGSPSGDDELARVVR
jgi:hypothetical protein